MRFLILLLPLWLTLATPAFAQEGTIAAHNSSQQDADIATRIREILRELGDYGDVTVTVNEGVVTLRGTAISAVDAAELEPLASRVEGVIAVKNEVTETMDVARRLDPAIDRFRARLDALLVMLPLALIALTAAAFITFIGFRLAGAGRLWDRLAPNAFVADIYRQLVRIVFMVGAIVIALDIMNATALLSTILGAAGIIGLALGFAVRDTVENFIASVMLSFRQPFRPNDVVEINGDQGKVIRLTSRATILLSFDGNHIRIPNATVFKSRIINFSKNAERRFMFSIMIDRNADLAEARVLVTETVQNLPFILDTPEAQAWIEKLDAVGVELIVTGWIDQNDTSIVLAQGEAIRQVKLALGKAGIAIPNATQTIAFEGAAPGDLAPAEAPPPLPPAAAETEAVAQVAASQETALDEIIAAEREGDQVEDLLRQDALKE